MTRDDKGEKKTKQNISLESAKFKSDLLLVVGMWDGYSLAGSSVWAVEDIILLEGNEK